MKMIHRFCLLICVAILPVPARAAQTSPLRQLIPEDPFVYVGIHDVTALREQLARTPFARLWKDPTLQAFLAPMRENIDEAWKELTEKVPIPEDWTQYFPGEAVFFIPELIQHGEYEEFPLCFATATGLPNERYVALLDKYIQTLPADAQKSQYEVQGVTVRMIKFREPLEVGDQPAAPGEPLKPKAVEVPSQFQYAFADKVLLVTDGDEKVMRNMVNRLKGGAKTSVVDHAVMKRALGLVPDGGQMSLYLSTRQLADSLIRTLSPANRPPGAPAPPVNIRELGLQLLDGLALTVHFGEKQISMSAALGVPREGVGIVSILRRLRSSPMRTLTLTPASALSFNSFAADWPGMYDDLRVTIRALSPMADMALTMAEQQAQIKFAEVVGAFDQEIGYYENAVPGASGETETTVLFTVRNAQTLRETIDSIVLSLQGRAKFESIEFLGQTIRTFSPIAPPNMPPEMRREVEKVQAAFVLADDVLAVSESSEAIKQFLQLKAGKRTDHFGATSHYKQARALLPEKIDSYKMTRLGDLGALLLKQILSASQQPGLGQVIGELVDTGSPPPASTIERYLGLAASALLIQPDSIASVAVLWSPAPPGE